MKFFTPIFLSFLLPNKRISKPLKSYTVSIDKIEKITGIDFFHKLPDKIERKLEKKDNTKGWKFDSKSNYHKSYSKNKYHTNQDEKININTASRSKLDQLYGIGSAKSKAIIKSRPYDSVSELTKAKGIGESTLARIKKYLTVKDSHSPTKYKKKMNYQNKINLNSSPLSKIKSLPGIGDVLGRRIIKSRPFNSINELEDVKGIGKKTILNIREEVVIE